MSIQISYKFVLKNVKNSEGLYPVYLRAFLKGRKIELATSIAIPKRDWSVRQQRVKKGNNTAEKHNLILDAMDKKAVRILVNNFLNDEPPLSLPQFKERLLGYDYIHEADFAGFIFSYLKEHKADLRRETWYSYKSQLSKIQKFKQPLFFSDINEKFINDYHLYMINVLKNNENTASKSLRVLRTFVNIAMRFGYIKTNPFQYVNIKKVDGKRDFLSLEELNRLNKYYQECRYANIKMEVLQYFLFACHTGLRYSDIKSLSLNNLQGDYLVIKMHKTNYTVSIPLTQKSKSFLPKNSKGDRIFKIYCNKVTNRVLKQIAKEVGITKNITFHVARHTFATTSISLGIPMEVVSKLLGHTNIRTTQVYAKIVDNVKLREMQKWDKLVI